MAKHADTDERIKLWRMHEEEREKVFEAREQKARDALNRLDELEARMRRDDPGKPEQFIRERVSRERHLDLLEFARSWSFERCGTPALSEPRLGDLPPSGIDFLNGQTHAIALDFSGEDDGKVYRSLLGTNALFLQILKEHFIYRMDLLLLNIARAVKEQRRLGWLNAVLLAAILWRVW
jgi:hypothetical protein